MTDPTPLQANQSKHRVLIIGGGFGGVKAALELSKHGVADVTLLSDHDVFQYYPALYHTATGGLYAESNIPLRRILNEQKVHVVQGKATGLDRAAKTITTLDGQQIAYDTLVLAIGVVTNYFGIRGLEENSFSIKSWEHIQAFKHHLHGMLTADMPPQHYIIVGGGPTGIELAGALPEYLRQIMRQHGVADKDFQISIVEAAPRLLPRSPEAISSAVNKRLQKLAIDVQLGQTVEGATADELMVNGQPIASKTVVWTAGTSNHPFFKDNNFALNERGKVQVDDHLRAEENIYVIGDNANTQFSGQAQTALYDGIFVAHDIEQRLRSKTSIAYKPKKPITVIPVGEGWAAVEWGKKTFSGRIGWWLRSAADWIGFHDLEPWWRASQQWLTEFGGQEDCPTCGPTAKR